MLINKKEYTGTIIYNDDDNSLTLLLNKTDELYVGLPVEIYDQIEQCTYVERHIDSITDTVVTVILNTPEKTKEEKLEEDIKKLKQESNYYQEQLVETQLALCDSYESQLDLENQLTEVQLALCDLYEKIYQ